MRLIVPSRLLTLKMVSSSAEVCSGVVPAFWGRRAERDSSSTCNGEALDGVCKKLRLGQCVQGAEVVEKLAYSNLEIHHLV